MIHKVTVIPGEGIGPEITKATLSALKATKAELEFDIIEPSENPDEFIKKVLEATRHSEALLKGPLGTPIGEGYRSLNVTLRTELGLFANIRPIRELPGVGTKIKTPTRHEGKIIDFLLVRENLEDLYIGQERMIAPDIASADKIITKEGCEKIVRASFELARQRNADGDSKKICCAHKANILKQTEGMLLAVYRELAKEYPDVSTNELIVDNAAQQLILNPYDLEVIFMSNLHGDILSDEAAALIGGLGLASSANIGNDYAMFEAVHGTAPDIAGKNIANPTSLMLSSVMMLSYLGEEQAALRLLNGINSVYEKGQSRTGDVKLPNIPSISTTEFANEVAKAVEENQVPLDPRFRFTALPNYRFLGQQENPSSLNDNPKTKPQLKGFDITISFDETKTNIDELKKLLEEFDCEIVNLNKGKLHRLLTNFKSQNPTSHNQAMEFIFAASNVGFLVHSFHSVY